MMAMILKSCKDLAALLLFPPDVATASTTTTADSSRRTGSEGESGFDNSLSSSILSSSVSSFAVDGEICIELDDDDDNSDDHQTPLPLPVNVPDVVFGSAPKSCFMSDRTDTEKEEDIDTEGEQNGILETFHERSISTSSISHSSSSEETGRTSLRRVHFYARVTVNRIPSLDTLTLDEKTAMYYAPHEYRKMKQDVHNTLAIHMQQQDGPEYSLTNGSSDCKELGPCCHNDYFKHRLLLHPRDEEVSYCFDGLYTTEELTFRDDAVVQSLCAVMSEQQFQWDNNDQYDDVGDDDEGETETRTSMSPVIVGDDDPSEYIARAYVGLEVHRDSTIRARRRAMYIASEVAEDEEQQEAKWLATLPLSTSSSSSSLPEESSQRSSQYSSSADDTADENDAVNNKDGTISLSSQAPSQSNENEDTVRRHQKTIYKAPKPAITTMMNSQETRVDS